MLCFDTGLLRDWREMCWLVVQREWIIPSCWWNKFNGCFLLLTLCLYLLLLLWLLLLQEWITSRLWLNSISPKSSTCEGRNNRIRRIWAETSGLKALNLVRLNLNLLKLSLLGLLSLDLSILRLLLEEWIVGWLWLMPGYTGSVKVVDWGYLTEQPTD